jgi:hypothetical protein
MVDDDVQGWSPARETETTPLTDETRPVAHYSECGVPDISDPEYDAHRAEIARLNENARGMAEEIERLRKIWKAAMDFVDANEDLGLDGTVAAHKKCYDAEIVLTNLVLSSRGGK